MTDHSELLVKARDLAIRVEDDLYPGGDEAAQTINILVDVVGAQRRVIEAYYKADSECAAACKTCDEAIEDVLYAVMRTHSCDEESAVWIGLRAARKLAQVAVENREKAKGGA